MTAKFDAFIEALQALCREHQVVLGPHGYDPLEVWDADAQCSAGIHSPGIIDSTASPQTPKAAPPHP